MQTRKFIWHFFLAIVFSITAISDVINDPFSAYLSMFETNALYNELTKTYSVDIDLTSRVQNKKLR